METEKSLNASSPTYKLELIAHPIRLRLIEIVARRAMTARQIAREMPEVPQTTLYRHLGLLHEGGILEVVGERPVRGTVEKTYALAEGAGEIHPDEFARASLDDHLRYYNVFVASLLGDFSRYLRGEGADPGRDRVTYNKSHLSLTEEEEMDLRRAILQIWQTYDGQPPGPGRRPWTLSLVLLPGGESEDADSPIDTSPTPEGP